MNATHNSLILLFNLVNTFSRRPSNAEMRTAIILLSNSISHIFDNTKDKCTCEWQKHWMKINQFSTFCIGIIAIMNSGWLFERFLVRLWPFFCCLISILIGKQNKNGWKSSTRINQESKTCSHRNERSHFTPNLSGSLTNALWDKLPLFFLCVYI